MRKRVRAAIERSRRAAEGRRAQLNEAAAAYDQFLTSVAEPLVQMLANALRAEGFAFTVFTPAGGLKLTSSRSGEDFIEFALDTSGPAPAILLRVNRGRGRRVIQHERHVGEGKQVADVTGDDLLSALLDEIGAFVER